ncbi:MAG: TonB-dependent receptor plug domain-containing protein, partial [Nostocaceae cyanobacterium]|nr:TonB-dependent receptor plug domain-containing protein [Nostocaceae cyanobacterium]
MKNNSWLLVALPNLLITLPAGAIDTEIKKQTSAESIPVNANILHISEIKFPIPSAELLTQNTDSEAVNQETQPEPETQSVQEADIDSEAVNQETQPEPETQSAEETDIFIEVIGEEDTPSGSTPVYVIEKEEIQKQGATSVADVLKRLPGFAINDVGPGADIHTGTYYRGATINQSVFLINGRPINNNVNTYHGTTDLNSIPVESIERVELSSGVASTLYGSSAFGGVVNIITKEGYGKPKLTGSFEYGSLSLNNQQTSFGGSIGAARYNFSFERFFSDNRYPVPVGAANRDAQGFLFNADTATSTYYGNIGLDLNSRNTLNLDVTSLSSRRGLIFFGFPLQRDRLDHDGLNVGLSWKARLGNSDRSNLTTTIGYNQDYFSTYGPTTFAGGQFFRTGVLDTQQLSARVDHDWQLTQNNKLRWGLDFKNYDLNGTALSTSPNRIANNEIENRNLLNTALFAVNSWNLTKNFQLDLGLRQNFDTEFGN